MNDERPELREFKKYTKVLAENEAAQAGAFGCLGVGLALEFLFSSMIPGLSSDLAGTLFFVGTIGCGVLAYRTRYKQVIGD